MNEKIKKDWNEARFRSSGNESINEIINGTRKTALQKLARRYRWFSNIALVMTVSSALIMFNRVYPEEIRVYIGIAFTIYFLISSAMDRWLYLGISKIDCALMPVAEVSRLAVFYRKRHLQFMMMLIPIAIMLIGGMVYFMIDDIYFIYGVIAGAIIGFAIGIHQFMEFMSDYRNVTD